MVFKAIFSNILVISWWSVLLVKDNVVRRENYRYARKSLTSFIT
jgi:hypothetical protein